MTNNSNSNGTISCSLSKAESLFLISAAVFISLTSTVLNTLTIAVILIYRRNLLPYWVNWLILSIAAADLLVTISSGYKLVSQVNCRASNNEYVSLSFGGGDAATNFNVFIITLQDVSFSASVFGMSALAILRYYYFKRIPKLSKLRNLNFKRNILRTCAIWIAACLYVCTHFVATEPSKQIYHNILSCVVVRAASAMIICVCYGFLAAHLFRKEKSIVLPIRCWKIRRRTAIALTAYCLLNAIVTPPKILLTILAATPSVARFMDTSDGHFVQSIFHWITNVMVPCFNPLLLYFLSSTYNECVRCCCSLTKFRQFIRRVFWKQF